MRIYEQLSLRVNFIMSRFRRTILLSVTTVGLLLCGPLLAKVNAQTRLTYPEINTALQTKLPNQSFKNKTELIKWIMIQVKQRKIDKPLTRDREDDLRQAGATDELIEIIRENSPAMPNPTPTPAPAIVELGDINDRAVNLVKPEYTPVAIRSGTSGSITIQLTRKESNIQ